MFQLLKWLNEDYASTRRRDEIWKKCEQKKLSFRILIHIGRAVQNRTSYFHSLLNDDDDLKIDYNCVHKIE